MPGLVGLNEVKVHLNIRGSADDDELIGFLDDAVAVVEDVIGPISTRTFTQVFDRHGSALVLTRLPVLAVSSVQIQPWLGAAQIDDTAAWQVNPDTGVLRRQIVGGSMPFYGAGSIFTVTYTAGRDDVPGPVNRAILMQVAEMWRSQRGAMPLPAGGDAPPMPMYGGSMGFLSPGVMELLRPYLPPPGLA